MGRNLIETVMGAVVLAVAGGFLAFAYNQGAVKSVDGYVIRADFADISGVGMGSEVRIGGMKVGVVSGLELNPKTYQATTLLEIKEGVEIPKDTSAAIVSSGLLGDKYVKLDPGGDDAFLKAGETIKFTQSAVNLEEMLGKFVFSAGGVDKKKDEDAAPAQEDKEKPASDKKKNPFSLDF